VSRSYWAWTKSDALVRTVVGRVARLTGSELRARPGDGLLVRALSSLTPLSWVTIVVMSMLIWGPAGALGKVGSPRAQTSPASDTHHASRTVAVAHKQHTRRAPSGHSRPHAELLAFGTGYSTSHGSSAVTRLQRRLVRLGYSLGPIDGRYGPLTQQAVRGFQSTHGLTIDGLAGPLTLAALAKARPVLHEGTGYVPAGSPAVRRLQVELRRAGDRLGAVDGQYGPLTERAVMRFQRAHHLPVDGTAGPQTLAALRRAATRRPNRERQPVRSRPAHTIGRSRPTRAPSHGTPNPATTGASPRDTGRRSPGSSLWIIALILLLVAGLGVELRRWHRRRTDGVLAAAPERAHTESDADRRPSSPGGGPRPSPSPVSFGEGAAFHTGAGGAPDPEQDEGAEAFRRGQELLRAGDRNGALNVLRQADELGHPDAAYALGLLLAHRGDRAGAESALRRADERGHSVAPFEFGVLLLDAGDRASAEDAFRRAALRGEPGAACNLGVLLEQRGDLIGAKEAYRRADAGGHAVGACNLGALLEQEGDLAGASEAYRRADEREDALGAYNLGRLLQRQGDHGGAKRAYRRARARGAVRISRAAQAALLELAEERNGPKSGRPPEVQMAGESSSRLRPPERQDEST